MALLVIHLWGKFWMAAWRGRRALTWITGVVAFVASVVECFTGYLSQQNFDSQWIATNGKDAFNAVGIGAFFNVMNFGQMLLWHVVLIPIVLIAIVGAHVLLVRVRGVSHPLPAHLAAAGPAARRGRPRPPTPAAWRGPTRRYDILKEGTIATLVVAGADASAWPRCCPRPTCRRSRCRAGPRSTPADFLATAATELNGTSGTATYGPPYNNGTGDAQSVAVRPGEARRRHPADQHGAGLRARPAGQRWPPPTRALAAALATYNAAPPAQQNKWADAYLNAATQGEVRQRQPGRCPPAPTARSRPCSPPSSPWPAAARSTPTCSRSGQFYGTDFTKPLLFLARRRATTTTWRPP